MVFWQAAVVNAIIGAMPRPRHPLREQAIKQAVSDLRDAVPVHVTARRLGISTRTLSSWLQWHPGAYQARLFAIHNLPLARGLSPKQADFWKSMRLRRLSLYREQYNIKLRPVKRKTTNAGCGFSVAVSPHARTRSTVSRVTRQPLIQLTAYSRP